MITLKGFSSALLLLAVSALVLTPMAGSQQGLTTITSWTTMAGEVTSTSYRTFAVTTTSITSLSTDSHYYTFTIPAQLARHCYFIYANITFKAADRVVGKVTVDSNTIDFYVMSRGQLVAFNHSPCDQAQDATAYVKALDIKSYVLDWVVPSDGEYDFVFSSYSASMPKPKITGAFSVQYILSQLVASTVYSKASTTIQSATTRTISSVYYSTVQSPLDSITSPVSLLIIGVIVGIIVVVALVVVPKREKTRARAERTGGPSRTEKEKSFCINCGAELPLKSKFCNKCGSPQS